MVARGKSIDNMTAPVVFRLVELMAPTLLLDEVDRTLPKNDELIGLLDSGHERGKQATRCVGDKLILREFSAHAPAALAGIGRLPGTLDDRSIIMRIERKRRTDPAEPFTTRTEELAARLARQMARWIADNRSALAGADPHMGALYNRAADLWRPLFAIADRAGDTWPELARQAQAALAGDDDDEAKPLGVRLLADIKKIFEAECPRTELPTAEIVALLVEMQDRPWPEMGRTGKPLTANALTRMLGKFGIKRRREWDP